MSISPAHYQALIVVTAWMLLVWAVTMRKQNAGWIDYAWTKAFLWCVCVYACLSPNGWLPRKVAVLIFILLWSTRLSRHLLSRLLDQKLEDARYAHLRRQWATQADMRFFGIYLLQGMSVIVLMSPFYATMNSFLPCLGFSQYAGMILWVVAVAGETIADKQLETYKRSNILSGGGVCQNGLWRYSRHPNYFFEILVWCAAALFNFTYSGAWSLVQPLLMAYFIIFVSGVKPTEQHCLATRHEAYRAYIHSTSMIIPWFKKS